MRRFTERFLPSPFSKKSEKPVEPERSTGSTPAVICVQGEFWCEFCFDISVMAEYEVKTKRLVWECRNCGKDNIVKGMEL